MKSNLKKKQIVWARTKGHPWWPGIVTQVIDGHQYAINFIGDDSQQGSILTIDNLFDFTEKFDEFNEKAKKNKKLREAIEKAQKMQNKSSFSQSKESQRRKVSESDDDDRKKSFGIKRNTRKQLKKPETPVQENITKSPLLETPQIQQKKQQLDREFQDLLILLIAAQLNYDQIKQKLTPILDTIEAQVSQNSTITEVLSERKGSILNAVYMILKHQSEQNPDHFFQRDIQQQITRLHDLISKLKNSLLHQFFNAQNIIQDLTQVCQNSSKDKMLKQLMIDEKSKQLEKQQSQTQQVQQQQQQQQQQQSSQNLQQTGGLKRLCKKEKLERKQLKVIDIAQQQGDLAKKDSLTNDENQKQEEKIVIEQQPRISNKENVIHKKSAKKNEIPDQALRRKVCFNLLQLVQMIGIEESKAKSIVLKIESLGREQDPQMKSKYGKLMWHSIVNLDCKLLKKEELLGIIEENADISDIWNKLTQQNDRYRKLINI